MGDQIKRYCEKLEHEEYEELRDNEVIFIFYLFAGRQSDIELFSCRQMWQMNWWTMTRIAYKLRIEEEKYLCASKK